ncbi:Protein of unknown function [Malonomonas rubra DSM 5091]|uniref:DUF2726 domain-containing protein n=1 Tax=Malonomonas rubra DSM 5091 TaxID=1122189 RepID=A0A1M6KXI3_MALRU|nr:DUF2726 domain-containing protein [Malonomonas rubra]SHJ63691.1 Protein of unknown function [Malonomonas rubra DSM 5091]
MEGLIFLVVIAVIIKILTVIFSSRKNDNLRNFPYEKQARLLSPAERSFFGVLEQATGDSYRIFTKVRLGDLFKVRSGLDYKDKLRAFNKISAKHIDFVICSPESIEVLAAIELDDKSHTHAKRKARDKFVNQVFEVAGLPLGRVPAKKGYTSADVQRVLSQILDTGTDGEPEEIDQDFIFGDDHKLPDDSPKFQYSAKSKPLCPSCGSIMEANLIGDGEGREWVCSKVPICTECLVVKCNH